jgi:hypothetical protein
MFGQTLEGYLVVNIMSVKISTMRQDERWLAGYKEVMGGTGGEPSESILIISRGETTVSLHSSL